MTKEERELALYCLKASSDYHSEVCEECTKYPNCDHMVQDDVTETIIKALEQEPILDKIRAEIENLWQLKKNQGSPFYFGLKVALDIIDRYTKDGE